MYCKNCGELLTDDAIFCSNCGTPVNVNNNASVETNDGKVYDNVNVNFNEPVEVKIVKEDKPSLLLNIVGFLSPIIGWIIWLCLKKKSPIKAASCGKWATISFVLNFVLTIIGNFLA